MVHYCCPAVTAFLDTRSEHQFLQYSSNRYHVCSARPIETIKNLDSNESACGSCSPPIGQGCSRAISPPSLFETKRTEYMYLAKLKNVVEITCPVLTGYLNRIQKLVASRDGLCGSPWCAMHHYQILANGQWRRDNALRCRLRRKAPSQPVKGRVWF